MTSSPRNEMPCPVRTSSGRGIVTLVAVALGMADIDRVILRLAEEKRPDVYAVFERHRGQSALWTRASSDLGGSELADWTDHRPVSGPSTDPFTEWFTGWFSPSTAEGSGAS